MKAEETISRFSMLNNGETILVGVSGGADSMALLHFLCSLRERTYISVYAAHINHGLRGEEAIRDENFVRKICAEWNVKLFVLNVDVAAEALKTGESLEQAGRSIRYCFFENTAKEFFAKIATAHTLSDSIETMLLNLARGTGLAGLCGIPAVRGHIIRPLIETTRREVEEYCEKNAILYMNDSTNFTRDYTRNKIRLDIVPVLYNINPAFEKAALRAMQSLSGDESLLLELAVKKLEEAYVGENIFDLRVLQGLSLPLLSRVLSLATKKAFLVTPEAIHIERLIAIIKIGEGSIQINAGITARVNKDKLVFLKAKKKAKEKGFCQPFEAKTYKNERFTMQISILTKKDIINLKNINKQYLKSTIDCDRIVGKAIIRSKVAGDKFSPLGRGLTKSLKKLFNEASIPIEDRELLPLICDEEGILWVYGFGVDERCSVTDNTQRAFLINEI
jgi:tRNA(Ile)-lysidine synthase